MRLVAIGVGRCQQDLRLTCQNHHVPRQLTLLSSCQLVPAWNDQASTTGQLEGRSDEARSDWSWTLSAGSQTDVPKSSRSKTDSRHAPKSRSDVNICQLTLLLSPCQLVPARRDQASTTGQLDGKSDEARSDWSWTLSAGSQTDVPKSSCSRTYNRHTPNMQARSDVSLQCRLSALDDQANTTGLTEEQMRRAVIAFGRYLQHQTDVPKL